MLFEKLTEIVDPEPHGAALNMAIDEVLLRSADGPLLRIYQWARPGVSFGYFGKYENVQSQWPDREPVRRWTGGGIVPHGDDLTYTLVIPRSHPAARLSARELYRAIHEVIAALLAESGLAASVAATAAPKISDACFENAAESDVVAASGKIAGAAQRRAQWGVLHQGSVQLRDLNASLAKRLASALAGEVTERALMPGEMELADGCARQRYATDAWLRKR